MRTLTPGNRQALGMARTCQYQAGFILLEAMVGLLLFLMLMGTLMAGISTLLKAHKELQQETSVNLSPSLPIADIQLPDLKDIGLFLHSGLIIDSPAAIHSSQWSVLYARDQVGAV